jgi:hypothetical protein
VDACGRTGYAHVAVGGSAKGDIVSPLIGASEVIAAAPARLRKRGDLCLFTKPGEALRNGEVGAAASATPESASSGYLVTNPEATAESRIIRRNGSWLDGSAHGARPARGGAAKRPELASHGEAAADRGGGAPDAWSGYTRPFSFGLGVRERSLGEVGPPLPLGLGEKGFHVSCGLPVDGVSPELSWAVELSRAAGFNAPPVADQATPADGLVAGGGDIAACRAPLRRSDRLVAYARRRSIGDSSLGSAGAPSPLRGRVRLACPDSGVLEPSVAAEDGVCGESAGSLRRLAGAEFGGGRLRLDEGEAPSAGAAPSPLSRSFWSLACVGTGVPGETRAAHFDGSGAEAKGSLVGMSFIIRSTCISLGFIWANESDTSMMMPTMKQNSPAASRSGRRESMLGN